MLSCTAELAVAAHFQALPCFSCFNVLSSFYLAVQQLVAAGKTCLLQTTVIYLHIMLNISGNLTIWPTVWTDVWLDHF